jgi:hypothetical protein
MKKFKRLNEHSIDAYNITYQILESIDFFNRYKALSDKYQGNEDLEFMLNLKLDDTKQFKAIMLELGYKVKITPRLIQFSEIINDGANIFNFNIGFYKIGICELHTYLSANNGSDDNYIMGDVYIGLYHLKSYIKDNDYNQPNFPYPKFSTYQEFKEIMQVFLPLYEDMKKAFIESGIRSLEGIENYFEE